MWKKFNQSAKVIAIVYAGMFFLLLLCNFLTPYVVDDFTYLLSFETKQPLTSIADLFPSMIAHSKSMNGRLVAHTLVQMFTLLPSWTFDIVNACVFVLQIVVLMKASGILGQNCLISTAVFCMIWLFEPAFGQVNLWQDGSVNYLWSILFGFLFLLPFVNAYLFDKHFRGKWKEILFAIFCFAVGAYSETVSAAAIFMAVLLTALNCFDQKHKCKAFYWIAIAAAIMGYISIYLAPAQWVNKSVEMSLSGLLSSTLRAVYKYEEIGILFIPYVIMLILNLAQGTDRKYVFLSLVFLCGSFAANFIMIFAEYYPDRSAVGAFIFLVAADVALLSPLLTGERFRLVAICSMAVLALITLPRLVYGGRDIAVTYMGIQKNEEYIQECKENGVMDVEVSMVYPGTPYSAIYGLTYLSEERADTWPNEAIARYYGVNSIIGVDPRS